MKKIKNIFGKIILLILIIAIFSLIGYKLYNIAAEGKSSFMFFYGDWVGRLDSTSMGDKYEQRLNDSRMNGNEDWKKDLLGSQHKYPILYDVPGQVKSDYWYIKNYRNVWCLSEGKINRVDDDNYPLNLYGIIEIGTETNPTYTKLYYLGKDGSKNVKRGVKGDEGEARRAQSAFTMFVGKNLTSDMGTDIAQRHFIDTFFSEIYSKDYLRDFYYTHEAFTRKRDTSMTTDPAVLNVHPNDRSYIENQTGIYDCTSYSEAVVAINDPIDTSVFKDLECANGEFTTTGDSGTETWATRIIPTTASNSNGFNMSTNSRLILSRKMILTLNNNDKLTYNIKKDGSKWYLYNNSNTKVGRIVLSSGGKICLKNNLQVKKVEVQIEYEYIHGVLYMLGGSSTQTRAISKGEWKKGSISNSVNVSTTVTNTTDVSMQKYITKVNGKNVVCEYTSDGSRKNSRTDSDESNKGIVISGEFRPVIPSVSTVRSFYKKDDPLKIKVGDKVTYRIIVYNNANNQATNITLSDRLPFVNKKIGTEDGKDKYNMVVVSEVESIKQTLNDKTTDVTDKFIEKKVEREDITSSAIYTGNYIQMTYNIENLPAEEKIYFDITLSFNIKVTNGKILTNTAFIDVNKNTTACRIVDRDYVSFDDEYKVSLEKFISKVNNTSYTNRNASSEAQAVSTYRFNHNVKSEDTFKSFSPPYNNINVLSDNLTETDNYHFKKYNEAVSVKNGDKVTFTIRLRNTGKSPVKVTQIIDSFNIIEKNLYAGIMLEYDSATGIKGNGGGKIQDSHYGGDDENGNWLLDMWLIVFDNPKTIAAGDHEDVTITYTVKYTKAPASQVLRLNNYANIATIENENNMRVTDSDGTDNNADIDYVKISTKYAVSLEKYVSKVSTEAKTGRDDHPIYRTNGFIKANNAVGVEKSDEVTYTIKLTNTGTNALTYGGISKIEVTDVIPSQLQYVSCGECSSGSVSYNNSGVFTWTGELEVGNSVTFTIKCKVKNTVTSNSKIENKAEIKDIYNKKDESVTDEDGTTNNTDKDWISTKGTSASLEKYVSKVETKAETGRDGHPIYRTNGFIKADNPVGVEKTDEITYTIKLTNTGTNAAVHGKISKIEVSDAIPSQLQYVSCGECSSGSVSYNNSGVFTWTGELEVGRSVTFTIKCKVNSSTIHNTIIENKAEIKNIYNRNDQAVSDDDGPDNNTDKDWIRIKYTAVALEKYVTKVESKDGTFVEYNNRSGMRYNGNLASSETASESNPNLHPYKNDNPVKVEKGDIVTFTIELQNTGEVPVKVTKIYDTYWSYDNNETELRYIQGSISGNGGVNPSDIAYNQNDVAKDHQKIDFIFRNAVTIEPGRSEYITIKFDVVSTRKVRTTLKNRAGIKYIADKNGENEVSIINNTASVRNYDYDGDKNNFDNDYVKIQRYELSLQKIVHKVNDVEIGTSRWDSWESTANISGENLTDEIGYTTYEVSNKDNRYYKHNNPVTVANGDKVVYAIKLTNNGTTNVKDIKIKDTIPSGLESVRIENTESSNNTEVTYVDYNESGNVLTFRLPKVLEAKESNIIYISAIVKKSNLSTEILRNYAEITGDMKNKNDVSVYDYTGRNNDDADYIQMKDITISGVVWNDKAFDKANTYNGIYDKTDDKEKGLDGVTVKLYREGITSPIATKKTVNGGKYTFTTSDIDSSVVEEKCNRFIKGPYRCQDSSYDASNVHSANYWKGNYYSYYVVFEYDGITYTSTIYSDFGSGDDRELSSNAREKLDNESFDGKVNQSRTDFNSRYDKINGDGAFRKYIEGNSTWNGKHNKTLTYDTVNKAGYIPSSIFNLQKSFERSVNYQMRENGLSYEQACIAAYNDNMLTILMSSSTKKIDISENINLEEQLQHVNLGLRGRDIFDLELTSDVEKVEVTVNDQDAEYLYGNKVTVRRSDLYNENSNDYYYYYDGKQVPKQDMANIYSSKGEYVGEEQRQNVRNSDINVTSAYEEDKQGLSKIQVTYKITVQNASKTDGTATKITNYYDKYYSVNSDSKKVAYYYATDEDKNKDKNRIWLNTVNDTSNGEYNSILITTPGTNLTQAETMEIYVVYTLNNPRETLIKLQVGEEKLPTYNMAEITEYRTKCGTGQTEFTRGLIDKDSAPGSVNKEQVRLTTTEGQNTPTIDGNPTTVQYYFGENDLTKLKYEDDTYATPTLYFVNDGTNIRTITGTVFEDETTIDPTTKIKTGNGKFDKDEGEVGVYGATVELIELKEQEKNEEKIKEGKQTEVNGKYYPIRARKETEENGNFEIKDFLPGEYIIRYSYGDTDNTLFKKVNKKSYNGEDFQATNNTGKVNGSSKEELYELNGEPNYWYLYNETEGISTAFDDSDRRKAVSDAVTKFTDGQMMVLNMIRDGNNRPGAIAKDVKTGEVIAEVKDIEEDIWMISKTNEMKFTVEKSEIVEDTEGRDVFVQKTAFSEYNITNMNFGIAEVPVSIVDLQKDVKGFILKDSTGKNIIASISKKEDGTWDITGDVIVTPNDQIDVSVENEKLQGARLEITYTISATIDTQINYDGKSCVVPQISGIVDFVNNNLSYNPDLGNNKEYWKITSSADLTNFLKAQKFGEGTEPKGMVDPNGNTYSTVLMATYGNPLIGLASGSASVDITLEAVLASTDMTLEQIVTSTIDTSEYSNTVEIIGFKYHPNHPTDDFKPNDKDEQDVPIGEDSKNEGFDPMRDRVRTPGTDSSNRDNGYIIIPGVQYDYATSGTVVVHTPTGTTAIDTVYYIVALIGLVILAAGVYGIKKFITKK